MDRSRWERMQALFHESAERSAIERLAFLEGACGGDDALVNEVLALLQEDAAGSSILDGDVGEIAGAMFAGQGAPPLAIQHIGPYRIQKLLGEGGMGVVYLAERQDLGSQVAIKILRDATSDLSTQSPPLNKANEHVGIGDELPENRARA